MSTHFVPCTNTGLDPLLVHYGEVADDIIVQEGCVWWREQCFGQDVRQLAMESTKFIQVGCNVFLDHRTGFLPKVPRQLIHTKLIHTQKQDYLHE